MEINWGEVLVSVITAAVVGAGGALWLVFARAGRDFWTRLGAVKIKDEPGVIRVEGIRPVFVIALIALALPLGMLAAHMLRGGLGRDLPFKLRPVQSTESEALVNAPHVWRAFALCNDHETPIAGECHLEPKSAGELIDAGIEPAPQYGKQAYRCIYSVPTVEHPKLTAVAYCAAEGQLTIQP